MSWAITSHPEGATLRLRVQPRAKRTGILGEQAGALKVVVAAPPQDGRANEAVLDLLREVLGVARSGLVLLVGHTNRDKVVLVRGVTPEELAARLTGACG